MPARSSSAEPASSRRRMLLGGSLAAAVTGLELVARPAEAASATTAWALGGNTGVNTDGTNYLGTQNVAPLVFKTAATAAKPLERMRITPAGLVGIGTNAPTAPLQVNTTATTAGATGVLGRVVPTAPGADSAAVRGTNSGTNAKGSGVAGSHAGGGDGVSGKSVKGAGLRGNGVYGVWGETTNDTQGYGVVGYGGKFGVWGFGTDGVYGNGNANGVHGNCSASEGVGVFGETSGNSGIAVSARAKGFIPTGLDAFASGDGAYAVHAIAHGSNPVGVYGYAQSTDGSATLAGLFSGNVQVSGTLSKSAGSFKIDHPLHPATKYLSHSFVESPDMMNVYNGNVTLDVTGTATVELPDWFEALNRDFRYQLTAIGAANPDLHVSEEIASNRFRIAGGKPGSKVSWQVTGIRQDAYANAHRIPVEETKPKAERGTYLSPELHGEPATAGVYADRQGPRRRYGG